MSHGRCAELPSTDTTDVISGTEREKGQKGVRYIDRWVDSSFDYASMVFVLGGHFEHSWRPSSREKSGERARTPEPPEERKMGVEFHVVAP